MDRSRPVLTSSYHIRFESMSMHQQIWESELRRGALTCVLQCELIAGQCIELRFEGGALPAPVIVRAESLVVQPGRVLLRVIDWKKPLFQRLRPRHVAVPTTDDVTDRGAGTAYDDEDHGQVSPAPSTSGPSVGAIIPIFGVTPSWSTDAVGGGHLDPPSPPAALPPFLDGRILRFSRWGDFFSLRPDLLRFGAVLAVCDSPPREPVVRHVLLAIESEEGTLRLVCTVQPGSGGTAVVHFDDPSALAEALEEIAPKPSNISPSASSSTDSSPATVRSQGPIENPKTPEEILQLRLLQAPMPSAVSSPSVPLLLRWLLGTRGILEVVIENGDKTAYPLIVVDGKDVRSPVAATALARSLVFSSGVYRITRLDRAPTMSHTLRISNVIADCVRALMFEHDHEALESALAPYAQKAPQLNSIGETLLSALAFDGAQLRIAQNRLDGRIALHGVLHTSAGTRNALEVIYLLCIYAGLDWNDNPVGDNLRALTTTKDDNSHLPEDERVWLRIQNADWFEVMGLHWSTSPSVIDVAYRELHARWGPAGNPRARSVPERGQQIWERIEAAYAVLRDPIRRKRYRTDTFQLQWSQQAMLLVDRAKLAMFRKDHHEAERLLEASLDILQTSEAEELQRKLHRVMADHKSDNDGHR